LRRPNPQDGGAAFTKNTLAFFLIAGNSYVVGSGPEQGPPHELYCVRPDRMKILPGTKIEPILGYKYTVGSHSDTFSKEQVLESPMVCAPLHLLEICATSDGAGALILCSLDKAKKYTDKPVLVDATVIGSPTFGDNTIPLTYLSTYPRPGVGILTESRNSIAAAYKMSDRKPEDIDIIELPDNSSWHYFAYLDCILQAQDGEAEKMLRKGEVDPVDGKLPVCPSGGLGASGEAVVAQGLFQIYELVKQLRGEAGERQVKKDLKVGLAQTYGYAGNNAACIISKAW